MVIPQEPQSTMGVIALVSGAYSISIAGAVTLLAIRGTVPFI
jgi:hypothetical protein